VTRVMVQRFHRPIVFGNETTPKKLANFIDRLMPAL